MAHRAPGQQVASGFYFFTVVTWRGSFSSSHCFSFHLRALTQSSWPWEGSALPFLSLTSPDLLAGACSDTRRFPSPLSDRAIRVFLLPLAPAEQSPASAPYFPRNIQGGQQIPDMAYSIAKDAQQRYGQNHTTAPLFRMQIPSANRDPLSDQAGTSLPPRKGIACSLQGEASGKACA